MKCKSCDIRMSDSQVYQGVEVDVPFCIICNEGALDAFNPLTPSAWLIPQIQAERIRAKLLVDDMELHRQETRSFLVRRAKAAIKEVVEPTLVKMGFPVMREPVIKDDFCCTSPYNAYIRDEIEVKCELKTLSLALIWRGFTFNFNLCDEEFDVFLELREVQDLYSSDWAQELSKRFEEWKNDLDNFRDSFHHENVNITYETHCYDIFDQDTIIEMWQEVVCDLERRKSRGEL